jgi:polyhydroxyalkanoate synthesis regulator phasin
MAVPYRSGQAVALATLIAGLAVVPAAAQSARRDGIGDIIARDPQARLAQSQQRPPEPAQAPPAGDKAEKDVREGDAAYEQARRLMQAIDAVLQDAARNRSESKKLPSKDEFIVAPIWTETREDRERRIRELLDAAMGIVTDVPVVDVQKRIETLRRNIRELEARIVTQREKQLVAPKDSLLPGVLSDTVASLGKDIEDNKARIEENRKDIKSAKKEVQDGLIRSGIQLTPEQIDLLLDGVLSGDLVRLVAVFNSARAIDGQLARLMATAGDNMGAARKYFAMHAALFAMLVHAQDSLIAKIDTNYMPKLDAILKDIDAAKRKTAELLRAENRPDQKRALEANRESQRLAEEAARGYRRYLMQQREQVAQARRRAAHDLRIADNTYETVEASFQLRNLMRDATNSFEAIQKLEAPTFEQIFKNEELRREFENLTRKLDAPSS